MKQLAFVIPYFGKFNNYFDIFLKTCSTNESFCDWHIFTDDKSPRIYPKNVYVHYMTWESLITLFQSKFDFELALNFPYKLCDFKVSYGYVFSDYLKEYEYWGHCDVDLIWGNLEYFLKPILEKKYDKVFNLGHCTLYKNTEEINTLFMKPIKNILRYKIVFQERNNCSFDEEYNDSINNIFENENRSIFNETFAANLYTKSSNFKITRLNIDTKKYEIEPKKRNFYIWNNGNLKRFVIDKKNIYEEDYLYLHMQSRKMKNNLQDYNCKYFKIIPNAFDMLEVKPEEIKKTYISIRVKHFNLHYFVLRTRNLMLKIKKVFFK